MESRFLQVHDEIVDMAGDANPAAHSTEHASTLAAILDWLPGVVFAVAWIYTTFADTRMEPAFFTKTADLYPLMFLALAVQSRFFAFDYPRRASPIPLLFLYVYTAVGLGATLLAIGQPSRRDSCVPWAVGGLCGMVVALAVVSLRPSPGSTSRPVPTQSASEPQ